MRLSLRSLFLAPAILAAAAALTINPASAEVLHVPFSFTVGNKVMPAGTYFVQHDSSMDLVTLRGADNKHIYGWTLGAGAPDPTDHSVILRFDKSDTGYALRSVQYHSEITAQLDKGSKQSEDRSVHIIRGE